MTVKPSRFIWYELATSDPDAAAAFYTKVAQWEVSRHSQPGMDYRLWSAGSEVVGGMMKITDAAAAAGMRPIWLGYVNVADVDETVGSVTQAGCAVYMPPTDIAEAGRMALVTDPQHAAFYVMKPNGPEGTSTCFAPGKPGHFGWNELHTSDWQAALKFYGEHLGWEQTGSHDMGPMGTYALFGGRGQQLGGMMNSPGFPRPKWMYYINVDDIDAAAARVTEAGGEVKSGPHQVPTGEWMIHGRDPQGAMFALLGPRKS